MTRKTIRTKKHHVSSVWVCETLVLPCDLDEDKNKFHDQFTSKELQRVHILFLATMLNGLSACM